MHRRKCAGRSTPLVRYGRRTDTRISSEAAAGALLTASITLWAKRRAVFSSIKMKEEAIAALLTKRNIEEAARSIGVAYNTLLNWMKLPEFQAAYREARRAAFGQSIARLQQGTSAAATTLLKTMIDSNTPASVKVRAAEAIFNNAAKAIEIEDIEARVAELERAAGASKPGHTRSDR